MSGAVLEASRDVEYILRTYPKSVLIDLACQTIALVEGSCDTAIDRATLDRHLLPVLAARPDANTL